MNEKVECAFYAIAAGIMLASTIWSLILPAIEFINTQKFLYILQPVTGIFLGLLFLVVINKWCTKLFNNAEFFTTNKFLIILSIILHNIPEGLAIGMSYATLLNLSSSTNLMLSSTLMLGIALQNFPESALVSISLKELGLSNTKACIIGIISAMVEPLFAIIALVISSLVLPILPFCLSFAAR